MKKLVSWGVRRKPTGLLRSIEGWSGKMLRVSVTPDATERRIRRSPARADGDSPAATRPEPALTGAGGRRRAAAWRLLARTMPSSASTSSGVK